MQKSSKIISRLISILSMHILDNRNQPPNLQSKLLHHLPRNNSVYTRTYLSKPHFVSSILN